MIQNAKVNIYGSGYDGFCEFFMSSLVDNNPQAAYMSCPLDARMVVSIPLELSLSLKDNMVSSSLP